VTNPVHHKRFPRIRATTTLTLTGALMLAGPALADASPFAGYGSSGSASTAPERIEAPDWGR